jgi:hypothetical protein
MGLSKRLIPDQLSFESVGSGGSSGWQAPEQLISRGGGAARLTSAGAAALERVAASGRLPGMRPLRADELLFYAPCLLSQP